MQSPPCHDLIQRFNVYFRKNTRIFHIFFPLSHLSLSCISLIVDNVIFILYYILSYYSDEDITVIYHIVYSLYIYVFILCA